MKFEIPASLRAEHEALHAQLVKAAEYERFVRALVQHAETEERVLYPAAILLGEHLERTLKKEPVMPNVA